MRAFRFVSLAAVFYGGICLAAPKEPLIDVLVQNELRVGGGSAPSSADEALVIIIEAHGDVELNERLLGEMMRMKLSRNGIKSVVHRGDFRNQFIKKALSKTELLQRKLLIEIETSGATGNRGLNANLSFALVEYRVRSTNAYRAHTIWSSKREARANTRDELEDEVTHAIQQEVETLVREQRSTLRTGGVASRKGRKPRPSEDEERKAPQDGELSYSLRWNDPDGKRDRFYVGAGVGTPALVNVHLGYWGSRGFPMVAGLSGMYLGSERRGIQAEIGWAFDNSGEIKQVVSLVGVAFNGTQQETRVERNIYGQVTKTTVETINELHPYVGPAYTIHWNDFRLQGGAALRADSSSEPSVRFLIHIAYTPAVRF